MISGIWEELIATEMDKEERMQNPEQRFEVSKLSNHWSVRHDDVVVT